MKRNILLVFSIMFITNANAQLVEHYENPQRFQFYEFTGHANMEISHITHNLNTNTTIYYSRRYSLVNNRVIYGVAIPIFTRDLYEYDIAGTPSERLRKMIDYYDTCQGSVILGNATQNSLYEYELLAKAHIRFGEAAMTGNYFKMPDADSTRLQYHHNSTYFPVIEVYFDHPQMVSDSFIVGTILPPDHFFIGDELVYFFCGPLHISHVETLDNDTYAAIVDSSYINTMIMVNNAPNIQGVSWGGPFPIVTPPPCMPPVFMKVAEQHRKGVTISWRVQYGTVYSEVEYGPQGFTEGTGTTVGPIVPDSNFNGHLAIDSLEMNADYTFRVRSYCEGTGGYSDWAEMDFHTESFYIVATSVNSDTCGEVRGGGTFHVDTTIKLYAYPKINKHFLNWSDGSNQNPRIVTVTCDTSFHAIFQCDDPDTGGGTESIEVSGHGQMLLTISPNPTDGITSIHCNVPILTWTLYDMKGCVMRTGSPATEDAAADLSGLPPAVYILSVKTESGYATRKIIVK